VSDEQTVMTLFPGQRYRKLEDAFWKFHGEHPEVYHYLVTFAKEWQLRGHRALGIAALFERVRWELGVTSDEVPKLNNNHRAFYARLLMLRNPELAGMFQLRQQRIQATFGPDNVGLAPATHQVTG
jgi:hypothetical protein